MGELKPVRALWYNLGLGLKVDQGDLDSISSKIKEPFDGLREILTIWLDQHGCPPTWQTVVDVLRNPVIDKKCLATALEVKYCSV